jgi:hypothetical protein
VTYFEPAVIASLDAESVEYNLKLWAEFLDSDGGVLDNVISYPSGAKVEKSLVLIKPDNFKFPNSRPGGVIEVFSRTGLYIVGFKVHQMSVGQAEEFYGPVLPVLRDKLGAEKGREAWEDIVEFMSGGRPSATSDVQRREPGTENASRSFTRAKTRSAKSATFSARPIRARRRRVRFAKSLASRS